jgi:nucleotide-binding universal stress UspA family protein
MAGRWGSSVVLLTVLEPGKEQSRRMTQCYLESLANDIKNNAAKYLSEPKEREIAVKTVIVEGDPAEEILKYAEEENVTQIMVATHGRTGLSRWALGSVAYKIGTASVKPVCLIRAKGARPDIREKGILRRALVPLDGTKESEAILPYIEELCSSLKADMIIFHMLETNPNLISIESLEQQQQAEKAARGYLADVADRVKQKGINVTTEFRTILAGDEAREIIRVSDEFNIDLVAMTTYGHTGIGRWMHDNIQQTILTEGSSPLLIVRSEGALKT